MSDTDEMCGECGHRLDDHDIYGVCHTGDGCDCTKFEDDAEIWTDE